MFILTLVFFVIWYFNSTLGITGIGLLIIYHYWIYYGSSKSTKALMEIKRDEINHQFNGNEEHFNYIKQNSMYFLYPAASKKYAKNCNAFLLGTVVLAITFSIQSNWLSVFFCVLYFLLTWFVSGMFIKPIGDYKRAEIRDDIFKFYMDDYLMFFEVNWNTFAKRWKN